MSDRTLNTVCFWISLVSSVVAVALYLQGEYAQATYFLVVSVGANQHRDRRNA